MNPSKPRDPTPDSASHWDEVYSGRGINQLSWQQSEPTLSLDLVQRYCPNRDEPVIDVGGGASPLAGLMSERGYRNVTVLDISSEAIQRNRERLGDREQEITWQVGDIRSYRPRSRFALWHDRALFHFMVAPEDRTAYVASLRRSIETGGRAVIATFSPEGPERCSGLDIRQYDSGRLLRELGPGFGLLEHFDEIHRTPTGKPQAFAYFVVEKLQ